MRRGVTGGQGTWLYCSAVLLILPLRPALADSTPSAFLATSCSTSIVLRTVVLISNPRDKTLQDVDVLVRLPMSEGLQHRRRSVICNLDSRRVIRPEGECISIRLDKLAPFAARRVTITSSVDLLQPEADQRVAAEGEGLESGEPSDAARELARSLARPGMDDTVRAVHNWVSRNVRYSGYCERARGVTWALRSRAADCSEVAAIVAEVLRSCDIASCTALGVRWDAGTGPIENADVHIWVELPKGAARVSDPLNGVLGGDNVPYISFARRVGTSGPIHPERLCWSQNPEVIVELVQ